LGPMAHEIDLAYLSESTCYTLQHSYGEVLLPRALFESSVVGQRPLTDADLDAVDAERRLAKQVERLQNLVAQNARLQSVGRRIALRLSASLGVAAGHNYGVLLLLPSKPTERVYGIPQDESAEVVAWVQPDGPAAGLLRVGDRVRSVDGTAITDQSITDWQGTKRFAIERSGAAMQVDVVPEAWPRRLFFVPLVDDAPNAFAVEQSVGVTTGLFALFPDDDDVLAVIVGHEVAHVTLGHTQHGVTPISVLNGVVAVGVLLPIEIALPGGGQLLGGLMQGVENRFNRDQERDADRVVLHYAAAGGYDPHAALRMFDAMETKVPVGGVSQFFDIHPPYPERRAMIAQELAAADAPAAR